MTDQAGKGRKAACTAGPADRRAGAAAGRARVQAGQVQLMTVNINTLMLLASGL
jgi:hypothetical protein